MRIVQFRGLNAWALGVVGAKVKVHQFGISIFPDGSKRKFNRWTKLTLAKVKVIGTVFNSYYKTKVTDLKRYRMPDGKVYDEYVQAIVASGGPVYYLALKDKDGQPVLESLWTEAELSDA